MIVEKIKKNVKLNEDDEIKIDYDNAIDQNGKKVRKAKETGGAYNYADAFNRAGSVSQQESIVKRFIREWSKAYRIDAKVKKIQAQLVDEMMTLGASSFDQITNPILTFLSTYLKSNELTPDQFIELNNMWANKVISSAQLQAESPQEHILLNHNLWKKPLTDISFIVRSYNWLSNEGNIKRYVSFDRLKKALQGFIRDNKLHNAEGAVQFGQGLVPQGFFKNFIFVDSDSVNITAEMLRNAIVFVDGKNPAGDINSAIDIERWLTMLENVGKDDNQKDTLKDRVVDVKVSDKDIDDMMKGGTLSEDDFLKIYKYAERRGWTGDK